MKKHKVIGIGLNKTGTKTLAMCLDRLGYDHVAYDEANLQLFEMGRLDMLFAKLDRANSCEDWPWPLLWRELAVRYPEARFILTVRRDADTWLRSLIKHSHRLAPGDNVDRRVYGYRYPENAPDHYRRIYAAHNAEVARKLGDRCLRLCWETGDGWAKLCAFLEEGSPPETALPWENPAFTVRNRLRLANRMGQVRERVALLGGTRKCNLIQPGM